MNSPTSRLGEKVRALNNIAQALRGTDRALEGLDALRRARKLDPKHKLTVAHLLMTTRSLCLWKDIRNLTAKVRQLVEEEVRLHVCLLKFQIEVHI